MTLVRKYNVKWSQYLLGSGGCGRLAKSLGKYSRGPYTPLGGTVGKGGPLLMKGPRGSIGIRGALSKGGGGIIPGPKVSPSGATGWSATFDIFYGMTEKDTLHFGLCHRGK